MIIFHTNIQYVNRIRQKKKVVKGQKTKRKKNKYTEYK